MTKDSLLALWAERLNQVQFLTKNVSNQKQCEQCLSFMQRKVAVCPICHAYRFVEDEAALLDSLKSMEQVPYPYTAPYVPRLSWQRRHVPQEVVFKDV